MVLPLRITTLSNNPGTVGFTERDPEGSAVHVLAVFQSPD